MSDVCLPNCVTGLPNFGTVNVCDIVNSLTSGEIAKIILIKCDEVFTDLLDSAEWLSKKTAGVLTVPFAGNGKIDKAERSGEKRIGCQTITTITKRKFEYSSPLVDNVGNTDWSLYNTLFAQKLGLSVMFLTCDGVLLVSPDWVTGGIAGIKKSILDIDQIFSGEIDGQMEYMISGEITEARALKRITLPQSVLAVL